MIWEPLKSVESVSFLFSRPVGGDENAQGRFENYQKRFSASGRFQYCRCPKNGFSGNHHARWCQKRSLRHHLPGNFRHVTPGARFDEDKRRCILLCIVSVFAANKKKTDFKYRLISFRCKIRTKYLCIMRKKHWIGFMNIQLPCLLLLNLLLLLRYKQLFSWFTCLPGRVR